MDPKLASKLDLVNIDILDYRIAANLFESAGDTIVDLAKAISSNQLKKYGELKNVGERIEILQDTAIRAFARKNRVDSIEAIKQYARFNDLLEITKQNAPVNILSIIYAMDNIARCWIDVVDLVKPVPSVL